MGLLEKLADFTVLPLLYHKTTLHALYLKEHVSKIRGNENRAPFPAGRTLFVVNIPPDATERELRLFFQSCGHVERIEFQQKQWSMDTYGPLEDDQDESDSDGDRESAAAGANNDTSHQNPKKVHAKKKKKGKNKPPPPQVIPLPQSEQPLRTFRQSGSSAYVIFTDTLSISRALALTSSSPDKRTWPPTTGATELSGLEHYAALHKARRPPLPDVKLHADSFLEVYEYNKRLTQQKSKYKKGEAIVDEDGFTLVTRGGAYGTTLGGGVGVASKRFMRDIGTDEQVISGKRGKKKPKQHEKEGFYKFQLHEQKRKELVDLKAQFEKDKEEVTRLRESRRFKPY